MPTAEWLDDLLMPLRSELPQCSAANVVPRPRDNLLGLGAQPLLPSEKIPKRKGEKGEEKEKTSKAWKTFAVGATSPKLNSKVFLRTP